MSEEVISYIDIIRNTSIFCGYMVPFSSGSCGKYRSCSLLLMIDNVIYSKGYCKGEDIL